MCDRRARPWKILDLPLMEITSVRPGYELWRPNREKAQTKTTKAIVSFVLLVSAGLLVVITIGGWTRLEGTSVAIMTLIWAGLYVLFALLVARWNRGILPVASALAIILAIFAAVSAPGWFARSKPGLTPPALPDDLIGLLCIVVVPVQLLLIAVAMLGFNQEWHVEEERPVGGVPLAGEHGDTTVMSEDEDAFRDEEGPPVTYEEDEAPPLDEDLPPPEHPRR
jgi:hypothetical protein